MPPELDDHRLLCLCHNGGSGLRWPILQILNRRPLAPSAKRREENAGGEAETGSELLLPRRRSGGLWVWREAVREIGQASLAKRERYAVQSLDCASRIPN